MNPKSLLLHKKALGIVQKIETGYFEMIEITEQVLATRSYFDFEMKSAFEYLTETLLLGKGSAQGFVRVARTTLQIPKLKEQIRLRKIEFWTAVKICSVITPENQGH